MIGEKGKPANRDNYAFWFSSDIQDWIHSKQLLRNRQAPKRYIKKKDKSK